MQIPVDIKAIFDEATDIDAARQTPVFAAVYIDESAPQDVQAFVRASFSSTAPNARVSISYFPTMAVAPVPDADLAVVVAGLDASCGRVAREMREAGVPAMVVTTLPSLAAQIAADAGDSIPDGDVVAPPAPPADPAALPARAGDTGEPWPLDDEARRALAVRMGQWVIDACREKRLAMALAFPFVRKPMALDAVNATAAQNAGVGLVVFIPGADMPIMTLNQAKMLLQIAAAYGQPLGLERVKELAAVVGGAFACRTVARQLVAFVPAFGWAVKAAIGYAGTLAMGRAAVEYFEGDGSIEHLAEVVGRARDKAVMAAEAARAADTPAEAVKSAAGVVTGKVRGVARNVREKGPRVARDVADSAVSAAVEGTVGDTVADKAAGAARSAMNAVSNVVTRRFTK